jgi:hypothetical protein
MPRPNSQGPPGKSSPGFHPKDDQIEAILCKKVNKHISHSSTCNGQNHVANAKTDCPVLAGYLSMTSLRNALNLMLARDQESVSVK